MEWKFYEVPDGPKDWPAPTKWAEYLSCYVESKIGVRIGYYGYAKQIHVFEYARDGLGFKFDATKVASETKGDYRQTERHLGPRCKVWIDNVDIAKMLATDIAEQVVSDIADVLLSGVLLSRTRKADQVGPRIEQLVFASPELENLNLNGGIAK